MRRRRAERRRPVCLADQLLTRGLNCSGIPLTHAPLKHGARSEHLSCSDPSHLSQISPEAHKDGSAYCLRNCASDSAISQGNRGTKASETKTWSVGYLYEVFMHTLYFFSIALLYIIR